MSRTSVSKRGRPLKFGRTSQLVTLTLPTDVIKWLESVDADVGWAVVTLHQRMAKRATAKHIEVAGLVPGRHSVRIAIAHRGATFVGQAGPGARRHRTVE